MQENSLSEVELNEKRKAEIELNQALQELYEVKDKINSLEIPRGYTPVSISKYKSVKLTDKLKDSDGISQEDVYLLELRSEKERQEELYVVRDSAISHIATINKNNELFIDSQEKEKYSFITRQGELDRTYAVDRKEMEEQKELEAPLKQRQENKAKNGKEAQIAAVLGVPEDSILMVVEVKDEATMSNVLNRNLETKNLYAIKLRQDSGGVGSNDWIIVNQKANGKFEQVIRQDPSDTMQDISQTLGLKNNNLQSPDFDPGDLDTVSRNGTRYTETSINGTRFNDEYGVLETQKDYKTTIHIAREDEDGEIELLCDDEHSEHEEDKIEFPDRTVEVKDDEEDRTPGGDAYERRFEHRH